MTGLLVTAVTELEKRRRLKPGGKCATCVARRSAWLPTWRDTRDCTLATNLSYVIPVAEPSRDVTTWRTTEQATLIRSPLACDTCCGAFSEACSLTKHKRIPTDGKSTKFSCDVDTKTFTESGSLTVHKRIHTHHKSVCAVRRLHDLVIEETRIHSVMNPFQVVCAVRCLLTMNTCSYTTGFTQVTNDKPTIATGSMAEVFAQAHHINFAQAHRKLALVFLVEKKMHWLNIITIPISECVQLQVALCVFQCYEWFWFCLPV